MSCEEIDDLYCTHEEADTRIFFHLNQVSSSRNVVIRTADTDCLIIALGNKHMFQPEIKIWLEVGVQSNNSQRFIDVNGLHAKLGEVFCKSLMGYHALTGCDYTASCCRKGKVKPLKILEKNVHFQKALTGTTVNLHHHLTSSVMIMIKISLKTKVIIIIDQLLLFF